MKQNPPATGERTAFAAGESAVSSPEAKDLPARVLVQLSDSAASIPELVAAIGAARASTSVRRGGAETALLDSLYDDDRAAAVYSALGPRVGVSAVQGKLQLVARFRTWVQGGDLPDPPPLTAVRILALDGLMPQQAAVMANLFVSAAVHVECLELAEPPSLGPALEAALGVVEDPLARSSCETPCELWPWQTRWSVLMTYADAAWREGERSGDEALLKKSELRARQALAVVAKGHPLTSAVSLRLLGAVLHGLALHAPKEALIAEGLATSQRAAATFEQAQLERDWALTLYNIQSGLAQRNELEVSSEHHDQALRLSEQSMAVIGEGTSGFWVKAALQRAQLLQSKWAHTDDVALLDAAQGLLERASRRAAALGPLPHARALGELCDVSSQLAAERSDVEAMARAVRICEDALALPIAGGSLEPYVRHAYGVALGRMGHVRHDAATVKRGVEQLGLAVGTAHRTHAPSFSTTAWANYGWGLRVLAQFGDAEENLRQAANASELAADARHVAPVRWARIKEGEANALLALGSLQRSRFQMAAAQKLYQEARSSFGDALSVFTKAEAPKRWARLEEHIGETLAREGEVGDPQLFAQALQAYQGALTINRRESDPAAFARTQFGLGVTYLFWADQQRGLERIRRVAKQSVAAFRTALKVHQELGLVEKVANDQAHLADALFILNRINRAPDCEPLELLLEAMRAEPQARGLWEPAASSLARFAPSKFDASQCPKVDVAFWKETVSKGQ